MSAFIISDQTMHRVVHAFAKHHDIAAMDCASLDELGRRFYILNAAAVAARYGEADEPADYRYAPLGEVPLVHMYKALDCLIYQCSEGDVPERPDYAMLTCMRAKLAMQIVHASPEYDRAPWDSGWKEVTATPKAAPVSDLARLEADAKAGRPVSLLELSKAISADRTARKAGTAPRPPVYKPTPVVMDQDEAF